MNSTIDLSIVAVIMPILVTVSIVTIIVLAIFDGKTKKAQAIALQFEALAQKLIADNEAIQAELAAIKGEVASINQMMKEIQ